ncbi:MAG: DUF3881 family protein [Lachnospiraceae bacterium]|nr:DUF3881 family protein [Lachnospiraceae bacterium]
MHKFLRAVGFSKINRDEIKDLVLQSVKKNDSRGYTMSLDDVMLAEFSRDVGENIGITAAGTFSEDDLFHTDYYFPYLKGTGITSTEDVSVERHAARDSYAGICDDVRLGMSLIFFVQNKIPYISAQVSGKLPIKGTTLTLAGLSIKGMIILPSGDGSSKRDVSEDTSRVERIRLMQKARGGDEDAIEELTMKDMDLFSEVSRRIAKEDLYSIVDTSLMPYGVECDQYNIIGEIVKVRRILNNISKEEVYVLTLFVNDLTFDVAINIMDLLGEPKPGRRFKGIVWLQGRINYPVDDDEAMG